MNAPSPSSGSPGDQGEASRDEDQDSGPVPASSTTSPSPTGSDRSSSTGPAEDQGAGCMPAVLAATALMGIVGFIVCALLTWVLFQKRTELAIRTLEGAYIPQLEQSLLDPDTKTAVLGEIEEVVDDLEAGRYENWQAAGIMQRLQRLPVIQWGELQALEAFLKNAPNDTFSEAERADGLKQLGRLRRAVELDKVLSFDFEDVLEPVRQPSSTGPTGFELIRPLPPDGVRESIRRAKRLADRSGIPDQTFEGIRIEQILEREIERGSSAGTY